MSLGSILIVDDEKNILSTLSRALRVEDYDVDVAGSADIALEKARSKAYDAFLLDVNMPGTTGLELMKSLRDMKVEAPVLVMSGQGTIEIAIEATRLGAHDFLEKPIGTDRLLLSLARALEHAQLSEENRSLKEKTGESSGLLGDSAPMRKLREQIERAASASAPVLVTGERGTGKELVARAIHRREQAARRPSRSSTARRAAGAHRERALRPRGGRVHGRDQAARAASSSARTGSTLFLDEVGDMPAPMQAKLLRVLQEGEVERVGGGDLLKVDVRVVAATNRDAQAEIEDHRALPRRPLRPPQRGAAHVSRRCASARGRAPRWQSHFLPSRVRAPTTAAARLTQGALAASRSTSTPATCASCATSSSAW
jgi:DNA-binding NtrC family response regulator